MTGRAAWSVSCDFDGTITLADVVQGLLTRFAAPEWLEVEAQWEAGRIGARECLERQTKLIRVSPAELAEWVDGQAIDPDAPAFFRECRAHGLDVRILSDGYDWVIHRVLKRVGVEGVPVVANRLVYAGDDRWRAEFPFLRPNCPSGVCKCAAASALRPRLHIGDGRSDACLADNSDRVFATKGLLAERRARGRPTEGFATFADLRARLFGATGAPQNTPAGAHPATPVPILVGLDQ